MQRNTTIDPDYFPDEGDIRQVIALLLLTITGAGIVLAITVIFGG